MAIKTADITSKTQISIKQQAENILDRLGIPCSVAIDMYYRQIVAHNGIPFPVILPTDIPKRDEMTKEEFERLMEIGLQQARSDDSFDIDNVI